MSKNTLICCEGQKMKLFQNVCQTLPSLRGSHLVWMSDRSLSQWNGLITPQSPPQRTHFTVLTGNTHTHTHQAGLLGTVAVAADLCDLSPPTSPLSCSWLAVGSLAEQQLVDSGRWAGGNPRCKKRRDYGATWYSMYRSIEYRRERMLHPDKRRKHLS